MKIASWNVNGIRAAEKKGFLDWLNSNQYEIVCLQETKAQPEQLNETLLRPAGYQSFFASAEKKGYSGVALYFHEKLGNPKITLGLGSDEFDNEGRTICAEFDQFILYNGYFPNGQRDHGRVPYKLDYSRTLLAQALEKQKETGKGIIICGDVNTAHTEIDLANPKTNQKTTGFLPEERVFIDEVLAAGFHDVVREFHPDERGQYTWWTYRGNCRERNIGWRIDYFFVDQLLRSNVDKAYITPEVLGSDHCPLVLELNL
jgi:exodeoxyribonuclease-3